MTGLVKKALARFLGWGDGDLLPEYIPNAALTPAMIPGRDAPMREIERFSLTFDGYWRKGSFNRCADVPWTRECATLSEMRACLYHELKRTGPGDAACGHATETFLRDLLDRMRELAATGRTD